ncbi:aryl-sulfate sulfotransferase [bacterium]|nr:aryl-sulfate sulfotransferase [bacterium]
MFFCLLNFFSVSCENSVRPAADVDLPDEDSDSEQIEDSDNIDDSDSGGEKEPVFDLKVEVNEKNFLSCRLTFSTADKKKTFVKYYSSTHSGYRTDEDSAKTEHYFFLWGMRENLDYKIEIYSDEDTPELLATTEFHSGFVPLSIYPVNLVANEKESVRPRFLLMTQNTSYEYIDQHPAMLMVDTDGFIVWYYEYDGLEGALLCDTEYRENAKTVVSGIQKELSLAEIPYEEGFEIDLEGNTLWQSPNIASYSYGETGWHHQYSVLDDDTVLYIGAKYLNNNTTISDKIVNVDKNYNELWSWAYSDTFVPPEECPQTSIVYDYFCDWTHTNYVTMLKDEGVVYINSPRLGFYKMDLNTKKILWKFGHDGDFTMLSDNEFPWTDFNHTPQIKREGSLLRILFFDNGLHERRYSRVIEYEINEDTMTAGITFEYDGRNSGRGWFAEHGWGMVRYMENGNILVGTGFVDPPQKSSIFEITRDGRVIWELDNYRNEDFMVEIYKFDEFIPPLEFLNE